LDLGFDGGEWWRVRASGGIISEFAWYKGLAPGLNNEKQQKKDGN